MEVDLNTIAQYVSVGTLLYISNTFTPTEAGYVEVISISGSGSAGIFMDYNSGNSRIDIRDASALRVRIGYLG